MEGQGTTIVLRFDYYRNTILQLRQTKIWRGNITRYFTLTNFMNSARTARSFINSPVR